MTYARSSLRASRSETVGGAIMTDEHRPPDGVDEPGRVLHYVPKPPKQPPSPPAQPDNAVDLLRRLIQSVGLLRRELADLRETTKICVNDLDRQSENHSIALHWLILAARHGTAFADETVEFAFPGHAVDRPVDDPSPAGEAAFPAHPVDPTETTPPTSNGID